MRAVTFQSMYRTSSPGWYSRRLGEVHAGTPEQAAVLALEQAVQAPDDVPVEALEDALRRRLRRHALAAGRRAAGRGWRIVARMPSAETSSDSASYDSTSRWRMTSARHVEHVLGEDVLAAPDERERAAGEDQVDRRARARAVGDVARELGHPEARRACGSRRRAGPRSRTAPGRRTPRRPPAGARRSSAVESTWLHPLERVRHPLDDRELLGRRRVADEDLEHEPVDLRLGQRVRALGLDRVLGREHEERVRHRVRLVADRDLALLHHLEQRALDLGRRPVDLVGEQEVREHRARARS